jgi:integrative and conjugative element protein (TIGR02256 family)
MRKVEYSHFSHRLFISSAVLKDFSRYFDKSKKKEAGGILLGHVREDYSEIVGITGPNSFDLFGYNYFVRSKRGAQPAIDRAWTKSGGTLIYLGEWHTHFEKSPRPSETDKMLIANSQKRTKMEIDFLFMVIVGLENNYWIGKQIKDRLIELEMAA